MTLPAPILDDRSFQDIVDECKRMIPRFTPDWTEHNVSDPGVTLIELFAWMTELLLYRVNQVPRRTYIKFLDLIGVALEAPQPARAELRFRLTAPQSTAVVIAAGTEVATWRTGNEEAIVFATERPLEITVPAHAHALVSRDGLGYRDYGPALRNPSLHVPIFENPPKPGNGFYLGYGGDLAAHTLLVHLDCKTEGIGVDPRNPPLAWEYYDGSLQEWRRAQLEDDGTGGLNCAGDVIVHIPATSRPTELDRRRATWLRCRVTEVTGKQRPFAASPSVFAIETRSLGGAVIAGHCQVITQEPLGRSDGTPGQTFTLSSTPVLPRRPGETLEVEGDEPGRYEPWDEVADFAASAADDPHFTCDSASGQISLGPSIRLPSGMDRQHGRTPPQGRGLRFTRYRIGGGVVGNVGAGTLTQLRTSIPYVASVTNPKAAVGGTEAESLDAALLRGPQVLRGSPRAVTTDDYARLAAEASPDVARAVCTYVQDLEAGVRNTVRVIVVPHIRTTDAPVPREQLVLTDRASTAVRAYLDARRMLTVRMSLEPPAYLPVSVRIEVHARPRCNKSQVKAAVETALYRFIHPTVGGPDGTGWPFDRPLYVSDIYGRVQAVANVEHLGSVHLLSLDAEEHEQPVTGDALALPPNTLLCSAPHRVTVL